MTKLLILTITALTCSLCTVMAAEAKTYDPASPIYEMRVYYSPEGKLDTLHARFRDHTMRLFEKHGITNVAYFVPEGANPEHKLIYFISFPNREAREKSWKEFFADPDWQKAAKESEKNGRIVQKVENYFLKLTDYSPKPEIKDKGGRVFELRTYTTPEGKLQDLDNRFKNHTIEFFKKHGMDRTSFTGTGQAMIKIRTPPLFTYLRTKAKQRVNLHLPHFERTRIGLKQNPNRKKTGFDRG